jgi:hypothetical protein
MSRPTPGAFPLLRSLAGRAADAATMVSVRGRSKGSADVRLPSSGTLPYVSEPLRSALLMRLDVSDIDEMVRWRSAALRRGRGRPRGAAQLGSHW